MPADSDHGKPRPDRPVLIEVGARFGLRDPAWAELVDGGQVECYLLEPDPVESEHLAQQHPRAMVRTVALGAAAGRHPFFRTRHPSVASLREPNWELLQHYAIRPWFEIEEKGDVEVHRLDDLVAQGLLKAPDFLHVDVQGFEAEVLHGAGALLSGTTGLKLELHPEPLYQGEQSLFEVGGFLSELGFQLVGLQQQGPYQGDFVEANCYFVNRRTAESGSKTSSVKENRRQELAELFIRTHRLRPPGQAERDIAHVRRRLADVDEQKRRTGWILPPERSVSPT
jgi:FkbM family methyltransferase